MSKVLSASSSSSLSSSTCLSSSSAFCSPVVSTGSPAACPLPSSSGISIKTRRNTMNKHTTNNNNAKSETKNVTDTNTNCNTRQALLLEEKKQTEKKEEKEKVQRHSNIQEILSDFIQKQLLIKETNEFFARHNIRLKKHTFPLSLPANMKDLHEIAAQGKEMPPYTTVYRHMCNLKRRILSNWSYVATDVNTAAHYRNKNIPFSLRDLTRNMNAQLDSMAEDLNDRDFTGVLLTLHTGTFNHPHLPHNQPLSKVLGGALVECLASNERCLKAVWMHPKLNTYATRVLLQAFLPRVILEAFEISIDTNNTNNGGRFSSSSSLPPPPSSSSPPSSDSQYKFAYAMHDDLDMCPRQTWLLLSAPKYFGLPRHYESSETNRIILDYGGVHTDRGNKHLKEKKEKEEETNVTEKTGEEEGGEAEENGNSYTDTVDSKDNNVHEKQHIRNNKDGDYVCNCVKEKEKCTQRHLLERLIGCSEQYMYRSLPTFHERKVYIQQMDAEKEEGKEEGDERDEKKNKAKRKIDVKKGWRDFIPRHTDPVLCQQVNAIIPNKAKELEEKNEEEKSKEEEEEIIDWWTDEWLELTKADLRDIQSDIEEEKEDEEAAKTKVTAAGGGAGRMCLKRRGTKRKR